MTMRNDRLPTHYIPHGGGPWPFVENRKDMWGGLGAYLGGLGANRPKAALVISAHWQTPGSPTVNTGARPSLLFDYDNFPEHTYRLSYPAPGSPQMAKRVRELLANAGIAAQTDAVRGFDHGVFIPFMLIYPDADVPIVQLSLLQGLDAATHLAIGRALEPLRDEGVLIVGSGLSYHSMRSFGSTDAAHIKLAERFDDWLTDTVETADGAARNAALARWTENPAGIACHDPETDHFLPLLVVAGAAGADRGKRTFHDRIMGKPYSGYQFG